jgi:hypothetical protein
MGTLLALQLFHVLFLALHDWIPLGRLTDTAAVRAANPNSRLALSTLISTSPFVVGLIATQMHARGHYPGWLVYWLWISYGLLFTGELRAWWVPYFFGSNPALVARYELMFGNTAAFLPSRHGIRPNTLHVVLHAATVATLVMIALATR